MEDKPRLVRFGPYPAVAGGQLDTGNGAKVIGYLRVSTIGREGSRRNGLPSSVLQALDDLVGRGLAHRCPPVIAVGRRVF